MRRMLLVLSVAAVMAAMMVAMAAPAFAEPSNNADCHGELNHLGNLFGLSPSDAMKNPAVPIVDEETGETVGYEDYENAGEWNKAIQDDSAGYQVNGDLLTCSDV